MPLQLQGPFTAYGCNYFAGAEVVTQNQWLGGDSVYDFITIGELDMIESCDFYPLSNS